ncbi:hypothetical protein Mapa_008337 [Marchantia paleacea]|nr:hypothetical protein Mapa_008337 [Marchantia paleacea]
MDEVLYTQQMRLEGCTINQTICHVENRVRRQSAVNTCSRCSDFQRPFMKMTRDKREKYPPSCLLAAQRICLSLSITAANRSRPRDAEIEW